MQAVNIKNCIIVQYMWANKLLYEQYNLKCINIGKVFVLLTLQPVA